MLKFKKIASILVLTVFTTLLFTGCKNKATDTEASEAPVSVTIDIKETETQPVTEPETEAEAADILPEGKMRSYVTGEIVDVEEGMKRPICVMINNISDAMPQQSGTSKASMLYEAIVEGNITRLLAVVEDTSELERLGSIRSARHNYIDFTHDNEGIYTHYGWSVFAENRINEEGIKTINGQASYTDSVFFRSSSYAAPHNVFTTGEMLEAGVVASGADRNYPEDYFGRLSFYPADTDLDYGVIANTVSIPFSSKSTLEYDAETKLYKKYQYGNPHMDNYYNEQLTFKNVIIQFVDYADIDNTGLQNLTLNGSGKAMFITNGKSVTVTWKRANDSDHTKYYYEDGSEVQLNVGKTYFAIVPQDYDITLSE